MVSNFLELGDQHFTAFLSRNLAGLQPARYSMS